MKHFVISGISAVVSVLTAIYLIDHTLVSETNIIAITAMVGIAVSVLLYAISEPRPRKKKKATYITLKPSYKLEESDGHVVLQKL